MMPNPNQADALRQKLAGAQAALADPGAPAATGIGAAPRQLPQTMGAMLGGMLPSQTKTVGSLRPSLTEEEANALEFYRDSGHEAINDALRGTNLRQSSERGAPPDKHFLMQTVIPALDSAINKHVLDEDVVAFRGASRQGDNDPGYTSVTTDRTVAERFAKKNKGEVVEVKLPKGSKALPVPGDEKELLLPRSQATSPRMHMPTDPRIHMAAGGTVPAGDVDLRGGGIVPQLPGADPNRDSVPAMVRAGDEVIPKDRAAMLQPGEVVRPQQESRRGRLPDASTSPRIYMAAGGTVPPAAGGKSVPPLPPVGSFVEYIRLGFPTNTTIRGVITSHSKDPVTGDMIPWVRVGSGTPTPAADFLTSGRVLSQPTEIPGKPDAGDPAATGVGAGSRQLPETMSAGGTVPPPLPESATDLDVPAAATAQKRAAQEAKRQQAVNAARAGLASVQAISDADKFRLKMQRENHGNAPPQLPQTMTAAIAATTPVTDEQKFDAKMRRENAGLPGPSLAAALAGTAAAYRPPPPLPAVLPQQQPEPGGAGATKEESRERADAEAREHARRTVGQLPATASVTAGPAQATQRLPEGGHEPSWLQKAYAQRKELPNMGDAILAQLSGRQTHKEKREERKNNPGVEFGFEQDTVKDIGRLLFPQMAETLGWNNQVPLNQLPDQPSNPRRARVSGGEGSLGGTEFSDNRGKESEANTELMAAIKELTAAVKRLTEITEKQSHQSGSRSQTQAGKKTQFQFDPNAGAKANQELLKAAVANSGNAMISRTNESPVARSGPAMPGGPAQGAGSRTGGIAPSASVPAAAHK